MEIQSNIKETIEIDNLGHCKARYFMNGLKC